MITVEVGEEERGDTIDLREAPVVQTNTAVA